MSVVSVVEEAYTIENQLVDSVVITMTEQGPPGQFVVVGEVHIPTTANSVGAVGQICADTHYIYVCVATNTWKRCSLTSW